MVITAMQPRRRSFTALFLDGEWVCNLDTEILCRTGWQVGQAITPEELEEAQQASDMRRAQEKALYLDDKQDEDILCLLLQPPSKILYLPHLPKEQKAHKNGANDRTDL